MKSARPKCNCQALSQCTSRARVYKYRFSDLHFLRRMRLCGFRYIWRRCQLIFPVPEKLLWRIKRNSNILRPTFIGVRMIPNERLGLELSVAQRSLGSSSWPASRIADVKGACFVCKILSSSSIHLMRAKRRHLPNGKP